MEHSGVLPPTGGTVIRVIDIPPESDDPEERRRATDAVFKAMFADADHHEGHGTPGATLPSTIDYAILLQGELVAVMDEDETVMKAGDILIQRGTSHAWASRSMKSRASAPVLHVRSSRGRGVVTAATAPAALGRAAWLRSIAIAGGLYLHPHRLLHLAERAADYLCAAGLRPEQR